MKTKIPVGERVRRWRQNRELKPTELAKAADISRQALWAIEVGESYPTFETIDAILSGLDLTESEFYSYAPPEQSTDRSRAKTSRPKRAS